MATYKSIDILAPSSPVYSVERAAPPRGGVRNHARPFRRRMPRYVTRIITISFLLNAVFVLLQGIGLAVSIFNASIPVGLALFLTGVGLLVLAPTVSALVAISKFKQLTVARSRRQFWIKPALYFLAGITLPWVALIAVATSAELLLQSFGLSLR